MHNFLIEAYENVLESGAGVGEQWTGWYEFELQTKVGKDFTIMEKARIIGSGIRYKLGIWRE